MSINRVVLTGRLTRDVELKATSTGNNVASFTVAVDGFTKDQNGETISSFINCVAWSNSAKFVSTYCKKGSLVALEGRLQSRSYDRKDGTKATAVEVIIDRIENLSPKDAATTSANEGFSIQENENQPLSYSDDDLPF